MGPVYLNAPLEVMLQEWTPRDNPRRIPPPPTTRATDADVEKIAELLITARNPVILTETAGRDPDAFASLVELADLFGIPVGGRAVFANFPKTPRLHLGAGVQPFLKDADLVLLVACRAPWYPPSHKPTTGTVVAIDENPLKGMMVYQSLQADHYLEGEVAASLSLLVEAAKAAGIDAGKHAERRQARRAAGGVAAPPRPDDRGGACRRGQGRGGRQDRPAGLGRRLARGDAGRRGLCRGDDHPRRYIAAASPVVAAAELLPRRRR